MNPNKQKIIDDIFGSPAPVTNPSMQAGKTRVAELQKLAKEHDATQRKATRTVGEKVLDFTGGKEIAQGLGQAIANKKINKDQDKILKEQIDIQGNVLKMIKEKKAKGEDTSRLEKALEMIGEDITATGGTREKLLNQNDLTDKQVVGDALQLATTASAGKVFGTANKIPIKGVGIGMGAVKGATTGAVGGVVTGGLTGTSQALQQDKDTKGILKEAGKGALIGGAGGAVLGAVVGGVSGGIKASKVSKQDAYLKAVTPDTKDLTPTEYEELLNKGKISPKTSTKPAQYILSEGEKNVAKKYKDIFTNDPVKNTERIIDEISKKDKEVGSFLKKNNGIFNKGELKNNLSQKLEGIDDLLVSDEKLSKAKISVVDNFIKGIKKNDMESLWKARKEFDRQIEKAFTGSPTLQNTIKKEFRNAVQDFISERTPDGVYKTAMKDMTELFNLRDVVNTKAVKEKGMNAIQIWIKRNPTKAKAIGWTAGTGVAGALLTSAIKN